jgi:hypothetical protein
VHFKFSGLKSLARSRILCHCITFPSLLQHNRCWPSGHSTARCAVQGKPGGFRALLAGEIVEQPSASHHICTLKLHANMSLVFTTASIGHQNTRATSCARLPDLISPRTRGLALLNAVQWLRWQKPVHGKHETWMHLIPPPHMLAGCDLGRNLLIYFKTSKEIGHLNAVCVLLHTCICLARSVREAPSSYFATDEGCVGRDCDTLGMNGTVVDVLPYNVIKLPRIQNS